MSLPRLHIVTDDRILSQPEFLPVTIDLLVVLQRRFALHIRARHLPANQLFHIVNELAAKAEHVGTALIINDRADIALAFDNVGIHLGTRSLPVRSVRELAPTPRRIGYSAHSAQEAAAAERDGADFILAGTIYQSATHPAAAPGGPALLSGIAEACSVPVIAIGGVTAAKVQEVLSTGAYGVAAIGAVWQAADPVQAAEELVKLLEE
ncbi:MAG: thiamine phosphate synthase [Gemmatimonadota bacterium]